MSKCVQCSSLDLEKIRISSRYTLTNFKSLKMSAMYLAKVLGALTRPNGMTVYSYLPDGVTKAVL